jgi:uncharacterized protein (TIGR03083 family)
MFDVATARSLSIRELDDMTRIASALDDAQWTGPTRCGDWSVADLCAHAGLAAVQQAEAFRRAAKGILEPPQYPGAPMLAVAEILDLLVEGSRALSAALDELPPEVLQGLTPLPFGVVPTVVAIQIPVYEYAFHADDLRHAIGDPGPFPADIAGEYMGFFPGLSSMLAAGAAPGRPDHAYRLVAPAGSVLLAPGAEGWSVVESSDGELCEIAGPDDVIALFLMGRIGPDDPRLTVSGSAAAAARDFKRWFPGP